MGPSDYQASAPQAGQVAAQQPMFSSMPQQQGGGGMVSHAGIAVGVNLSSPPQGELVRIYERLMQFHSRICDQRDQLITLNEKVGVRHIPQQAIDKTSPATPPQAEGVLPAIESQLSLIAESIDQLQYQIDRAKLL